MSESSSGSRGLFPQQLQLHQLLSICSSAQSYSQMAVVVEPEVVTLTGDVSGSQIGQQQVPTVLPSIPPRDCEATQTLSLKVSNPRKK